MSIPFPKPAADVIAAPPLPPPGFEQQVLESDHPEIGAPGKDENAAGLLYQAELGVPPKSHPSA